MEKVQRVPFPVEVQCFGGHFDGEIGEHMMLGESSFTSGGKVKAAGASGEVEVGDGSIPTFERDGGRRGQEDGEPVFLELINSF